MRLTEFGNNKTTIYFMMVYSNPPTYGYKLAFEKLKKISQHSNHIVFINPLEDSEINPLPFNLNLKYNKKIFPNVNFYTKNNIKNPLQALKLLSKKFEIINFLTKDENLDKFKRFHTYAEEWGIYEFNLIGLGDSKSEKTRGKTNKIARQAVLDNNFSVFKKTIPTNNDKLKASLFLDMRKYMMGISKTNESVDDVREISINETVNNIIDFIEEKNSGISIINEYIEYDSENNMIFPLDHIDEGLSNIKLCLTENYKNFSIGKDKDENFIIFLNYKLNNLNENLQIHKEEFQKVFNNIKQINETITSGNFATVVQGLGSPIKRNMGDNDLSFVDEIKKDPNDHNKLSNAMKKYVDKYGYITKEAIDQIRKKLDG